MMIRAWACGWLFRLALMALATGLTSSVLGEEGTTLAILHATIVHPERDPDHAVERDASVLISGSRIQAVGPAAAITLPPGAQSIDARGKWLIPGLIDTHVHFFQSGNLYTRPDVVDFTRVVPYRQEMARNVARLPATFKVWLASGVTSVIDTGGPLWNFEMREAARRTPEAPRVLAAGPLISTIARPELDLGDPPILYIATPEQAKAEVQRQLPYRPDFIKVWFIYQPGDDIEQQAAVVRAAAQAAHAGGVRLAVHATELETAKAALRAGTDFLVHSVGDWAVDDEFIALARQRHVIYCPTLFVMMGYTLALSNTWQPTDAERRLADPQVLATMHDLDRLQQDKIPLGVRALMRNRPVPRTWPDAIPNVKRVWDAGITVSVGSDAGNIGTLHGPSIFRELELLEQAGLTPLQVLRAATLNGAKALALETELGTIAPGKLADLVLLDGDPLEDLENLSRIFRVLRDGRVYDPAALIESIR
jgi:imidazolonepropionase-like amidohydrolase